MQPPLSSFFFFNDTATTEIYTLSLHDALPISRSSRSIRRASSSESSTISTRNGLPIGIKAGGSPWHRSEEHTSELQSQSNLVCRLLLEKKKKRVHTNIRDFMTSAACTRDLNLI